jgi:tRNA(Ile)-lysidine synthase
MTFRAGVEATLRRRGMLKGGERVIVAVSGGPDSLALLYVLRDLSEVWGLTLHVAHFDHRLRPGSAADAAFVGRVARRLGLPITTGSASPELPSAGHSPEEAARERRLFFLETVADAVAADRIATGHTLDDQAETVLMRLLLGAGPRGLGGIPPVRGSYIRPLIDRRRAETEAYCRSRRLRPRRDPTNDDPALLRNAIRSEVLPFLTARVNARLPDALARAADVLREEDAVLDELAAASLEPSRQDREIRLPLDALNGLPLALRRRVLRHAVEQPVGFTHVEQLIELAAKGRSGDALDLPQGLNARLEYGSLLIGRAPSPAQPPEPVALVVPGRTELPAWGAVATAWVERARPKVWPDGKGTCVIDAERLGPRPVVRSPRRGDRFVPLGTPGTKSVADLLAEAKVPRADRTRVPVVADGNGIIWVVGHRTSDRYKATDETQRFLWLSIEGGDLWRS